MKDQIVLVTGAGGFIGSHLVVDQLKKGRSVRALDLNVDRIEHLRHHAECTLIEGDVRDKAVISEALEGVRFVFHLASAHLEVSRPDRYFWQVNVEAVRQLVRAASRSGVQRFVHCSTVGVYGPLRTLPASEDTECKPDIVYEITKLQGEKALREVSTDSGLPVVILRPAWVYGPGCRRTRKLFNTVANRRFVFVGSGENLRHPLYIDDMLESFELAATTANVEGEVFIIASDRAVMLRDLIDNIMTVQGLNYHPPRVPLAVMKPVCVLVEGMSKVLRKEPPFSQRSLKFFTDSSAFDISKSRRVLRFTPRISLLEGLSMTHASFQSDES